MTQTIAKSLRAWQDPCRKAFAKKICLMAPVGLMMMMAIAFPDSLPGQVFTTIASFNDSNVSPNTVLIQGLDGNLYGTTGGDGLLDNGTIFRVSTAGEVTTLHTFSYSEGASPNGLVQTANGDFYGTAFQGGDPTCGCGTVFHFSSAGVLNTLYTFGPTESDYPKYGLFANFKGNVFYGLTSSNITFTSCPYCGTIFRITAEGNLTTVHQFTTVSGESPSSTLVPGDDGSLYGTTYSGGANAAGTLFRVSPDGAFEDLHVFDLSEGDAPGGLISTVSGKFYGHTLGSGAGCSCGTIFASDLNGDFRTIYEFGADGPSDPAPAMVLASDGNLYGATAHDARSERCADGGCGTLFRLTPDGELTTLYVFTADSDGQRASGGLMQATDGNIYGVSDNGGTTGDGSVFRLSLGLKPFVKTLPHAGSAGTVVEILGTNLTNATNVSFDGIPTSFTVVSGSEISAIVPAGASTARVVVALPDSELLSAEVFVVLANQ